MRTSGSMPGSKRLEVLRRADLAADDDARVVGHVLRLEGCDTDAATPEGAGQRSDDEALAGEAGDALDGERAQRVRSKTAGREGMTATLPSTSTTRIEAP